jgi:hypothetical protein
MFPSLASGDGRRHTDVTASIAELIGIDPIGPTSSS